MIHRQVKGAEAAGEAVADDKADGRGFRQQVPHVTVADDPWVGFALRGERERHRILLLAVVAVRQFFDDGYVDLGGGLISVAPEDEIVGDDLYHQHRLSGAGIGCRSLHAA